MEPPYDHLRRYTGNKGLSIESNLPLGRSPMPAPNQPAPGSQIDFSEKFRNHTATRPVQLLLLICVAALGVSLAIAVAQRTTRPPGAEVPPPKARKKSIESIEFYESRRVPVINEDGPVTTIPSSKENKASSTTKKTRKKDKKRNRVKRRMPQNKLFPPAEEL